jgi:four helix bundle protein
MGLWLAVVFRKLCVIVNVMSESIIKKKTFDFAVRVAELCRVLNGKEKEFVLSRQLLRSGTSIGANVREALNCHTKREFIYKLSIS